MRNERNNGIACWQYLCGLMIVDMYIARFIFWMPNIFFLFQTSRQPCLQILFQSSLACSVLSFKCLINCSCLQAIFLFAVALNCIVSRCWQKISSPTAHLPLRLCDDLPNPTNYWIFFPPHFLAEINIISLKFPSRGLHRRASISWGSCLLNSQNALLF